MNSIILLIAEIIGVIAVTLILSISPLLKSRRPVKFTHPQREGFTALSIGVYLILFNALAINIFPFQLKSYIPFQIFQFTGFQLNSPGALNWSLVIEQMVFMIISVIPLGFLVWQRKQPWLSIGLKNSMIKGGFQVAFALALITIFLRGKVSPLINGGFSPQSALLLLVTILVILIVEVIFRGYIQLRLTSWLGESQGWLLTAVIYAIWSTIPLFQLSPMIWITTTLYQFGMGLLYGWISRRTGSILGGWMYHAAHIWLFWI